MTHHHLLSNCLVILLIKLYVCGSSHLARERPRRQPEASSFRKPPQVPLTSCPPAVFRLQPQMVFAEHFGGISDILLIQGASSSRTTQSNFPLVVRSSSCPLNSSLLASSDSSIYFKSACLKE